MGVKRTTILEILDLIMARRHQAIEKVNSSIVLKNANCELPWLLQLS